MTFHVKCGILYAVCCRWLLQTDFEPKNVLDAVFQSACFPALKLKEKYIAVNLISGNTAQLVSRFIKKQIC